MKKRIAAALCLLLLSGCTNGQKENLPAAAYITEPKAEVTYTVFPETEPTEQTTVSQAETSVSSADFPPEETGTITLLGPNMVYTGESFAYRYEISGGSGREPEILWQCDGTAGTITKDGEFSALEKGTVTLTAVSAAGTLSDSLTVHVVDTAADVDFVPTVNGIPIVNKTYPLPADYCPGDLTEETLAAFKELVASAAADGIEITFNSGFRSYQYQAQVHDKWIERYGEEMADRLSARPGHSEHQLGLAIDVNSILSAFADTPEGIWLGENCWKYGFIIRYSQEKEEITGYIYEPWHIRYLGKELAREVTESGLCLEEYLGIDSYYRDP